MAKDYDNGALRTLQDSNIRIRLYDGTYEASIDPLGYLVGIDTAHHKIHEGDYFSVFYEDLDVDIIEPIKLIIRVGPKDMHFTGIVKASSGFKVELWEGISVSAAGTPITAFNHYRPLAAGTTDVQLDGASPVGGTVIDKGRLFGTGVGVNKVGGDLRTNTEWVLDSMTDYMIMITVTADTTSVFTDLEWYEEDTYGYSSSTSSSSTSSSSESSSSESSSSSTSSSSSESSSSSTSSSSVSSSSESSSSESSSSESSSSSTSSSSKSSSSKSSSSSATIY